ncbi:MAG: acyltransferase [Paludibacteraceae bacterium]|nr:acyltransferase [Paludibacteraceae bacterium]
MENKGKSKIEGIDFAKACCAIGIIIFHFFCHSNGTFKFLYDSANASWGEMIVTAFFAMSGAVLYYNYPKDFSLKKYYFKRWKSIFPAFYMCFLFFFLKNVFSTHQVFYGPECYKMIFTLFGIDGYFWYKIPNYYIIGEWFLGAIIMLYILYPLLTWAINKSALFIPVILVAGYIWMLGTVFFEIITFRNMITCTASFYFGMIGLKYKDLFFRNKTCGIISFLVLLFLCCVEIQQSIIIFQIQGLALLIVLIQSGNIIMKTRLKSFFSEIAKLSFCIFLFQHIIILDVLGVYNPDSWHKILITLGITIILTITCAKVLSIVVEYFLQSAFFKRIESTILR